jgi:nucleotide-binding universal stress UspA family protein
MIKNIIVNLPVGEASVAAIPYAISVASAFKAHLTGVAFTYKPVLPGTVFGSVRAELIDAALADLVKAAKSAGAKFDDAARIVGLSADSRVLEATPVEASQYFGQFARCFDLAIVGQPEPGKTAQETSIVEAALFESGRPVLVVPYIQQQPIKLDRVLVCWDGSRNAARAIADALPFLSRATAVDVVVVEGEPGKLNEIAGADIAHHLARHGLNVDVKRLVVRDVSVANTILSLAADVGADMIVMGGYGHSRLREFVLGGATRDILSTMTVPTLMSH